MVRRLYQLREGFWPSWNALSAETTNSRPCLDSPNSFPGPGASLRSFYYQLNYSVAYLAAEGASNLASGIVTRSPHP